MSDTKAMVEALAKGGFIMTEPHQLEGYPRSRKLVIGFKNGQDADDAMHEVAKVLKARRMRERNRHAD